MSENGIPLPCNSYIIDLDDTIIFNDIGLLSHKLDDCFFQQTFLPVPDLFKSYILLGVIFHFICFIYFVCFVVFTSYLLISVLEAISVAYK